MSTEALLDELENTIFDEDFFEALRIISQRAENGDKVAEACMLELTNPA